MSYFDSKNDYNSGENDANGKKFKLVLKTIYKNVFSKYQPNQRFPSIVLGLRETILELYFYSKNGQNLGANNRTEKKFTLVLKTTYKKVILKYQVNPLFPSMCLASKNAIFGGGRRKKKSRQVHRERTGCPN